MVHLTSSPTNWIARSLNGCGDTCVISTSCTSISQHSAERSRDHVWQGDTTPLSSARQHKHFVLPSPWSNVVAFPALCSSPWVAILAVYITGGMGCSIAERPESL